MHNNLRVCQQLANELVWSYVGCNARAKMRHLRDDHLLHGSYKMGDTSCTDMDISSTVTIVRKMILLQLLLLQLFLCCKMGVDERIEESDIRPPGNSLVRRRLGSSCASTPTDCGSSTKWDVILLSSFCKVSSWVENTENWPRESCLNRRWARRIQRVLPLNMAIRSKIYDRVPNVSCLWMNVCQGSSKVLQNREFHIFLFQYCAYCLLPFSCLLVLVSAILFLN